MRTHQIPSMASPANAVPSPFSPATPSGRHTTGSCEPLCRLSFSHRVSPVCEEKPAEFKRRSLRSRNTWEDSVCLLTQQKSRRWSGNTSHISIDSRNFREIFSDRERGWRFFAPLHHFRLSAQRQAEAEGQGVFIEDLDGTAQLPELLPFSHGQLVVRPGPISALSQCARRNWVCCCSEKNAVEGGGPNVDGDEDEDQGKPGVKYALTLLRLYKNEISPFLPASCRYVPTCSVYAQEAYKKYGVLKGTVLTMWRLARCNPFGGSGFDPPRWFDEKKPPSV